MIKLDCIDEALLTDIYDMNNLHYNIVKEDIIRGHYYNMTENTEILMEGFSDMLSKMGDYFKTLIEKIKAFFKKVLIFVDSCFMELDKFVKKYKKELDNISDLDFEIEGYEFTLHNPPDMSEFESIVNDYNSQLSEVEKINKTEIFNEQKKFLDDDHLCKLRGQILGSNKAIHEDDFQETVRKYYRNGEEDTHYIKIKDSDFKKLISNIPDMKKGKDEAEKTRDKLVILLDKTQKFFDTKATVMYKNNVKSISTKRIDTSDNEFKSEDDDYVKYSESTVQKLEVFLKFKYNQVNKIAGMVNLVASERANAYKDQLKQARLIVKEAISYKPDKKEDK